MPIQQLTPREVTLPNGRRLGYAEWGPRGGPPVVYFHGVPSSRLDAHMFDGPAAAERTGVRLLAIDRPGCGRSDFQPGRKITDWPADVAAFADRIGLTEFAVLGWSGGGAYALACAHALPERVTAATVVSGMGPHDVPGLTDGANPQSLKFFALNRDHPWVGRLQDRLMAWGAGRSPDTFVARTTAAMPTVDRVPMGRPEVATAYVDAVRECFRHGPRGAQVDTALMASAWQFDPTRISIPVHIWHGERDVDAPVAMGRWMAKIVPTSRARFFPDEGHISLIVNHADDILRSLTDHSP